MTKLRIEIDEPCTKPGVTFEMRDGVRHCHSCDAPQHDFTQSTERETLAVFAAHGNRLCGKFLAGPSGAVRFRPERPKRSLPAALVALTLAACDPPEATTTTVIPEIALPPPTTTTPATPPPPDSVAPPETAVAQVDPLDTVSSASEQADHSTDGSSDPNDHTGHWHTHPPVHHRSGGARAYPPHSPGDPLDL